MTTLPLLNDARRPPRLRLPEHTPAVLRMHDGACTTAELQVVSLTGGLLSLTSPLRPSLTSKLLFVSSSGPIMGVAEMLHPVMHLQQPFRFVSMDNEYLCRLQGVIQNALYPVYEQEEWIRKYRLAIDALDEGQRRSPFRSRWSAGLALLGGISGLCAAYLHWLK